MSTFDIISDSGTGVKAFAWFRSKKQSFAQYFSMFWMHEKVIMDNLLTKWISKA